MVWVMLKGNVESGGNAETSQTYTLGRVECLICTKVGCVDLWMLETVFEKLKMAWKASLSGLVLAKIGRNEIGVSSFFLDW